eukprot:CAMPEP_0182453868 /NCGR_PEP_ID=MMETSP1319-20130603/742_1 /TAXON_ID=172717 /ORGANISM="Bolidomonas pacifica, Strain RCC208" /LENGTH=351 /DNA_ID=CAMNT_0024651825 /DNA_START=240 /DNA_END=1296 /DNA_ORIENTATION=+
MHFLLITLITVVGLVSADIIPPSCRPAYAAYEQCLLDITEAPTEAPTQAPNVSPEWDGYDLTLTHYWDCSGQACDSRTLQPWDYDKYRSPPGYAPQDPDDFGGSLYGEKVWVTAAIMNIDLGPDDPCCGKDDFEGCGKCLLISNPDSIHPEWTVLAMKKNTGGIGLITWPHVDINAPGYDDLDFSWANICGEQGTGLSQQESSSLGKWYNDYDNARDAGEALCGNLPAEYAKGCKLFSDWGWTGGMTKRAKFKHVECPEPYKEFISGLFDENGVVGGPPGTPPTPAVPEPLPQLNPRRPHLTSRAERYGSSAEAATSATGAACLARRASSVTSGTPSASRSERQVLSAWQV